MSHIHHPVDHRIIWYRINGLHGGGVSTFLFSCKICFVDDKYQIREEFASFIYCNKGISGADIFAYIKKELVELGLNLTRCRGQEFVGAGNIAGKYNGAARLFQNEYPLAAFVHCASHRFNLCVANSCFMQMVRNMMNVVKEVSDFFNNSPKRQEASLSMI